MLWENIIDVGVCQFTLPELEECLDTFHLDEIHELYRGNAFDGPTKILLRSYFRERMTAHVNSRDRQ